MMAFFLKWLAEERQARLELFIWGCISSRRNARKVPLCHRGLTVKNARARGALRGRGRALARPGTQIHVPVCLKSRARSIFPHHLCLLAAGRLQQLCIAALAGRCWALGNLHPRTYSGALTRTRRRRCFCAMCTCLRVASTTTKKVNITPGGTLGKCHLATGASQKKTPRARGALRGRGRALACPGTQTHVLVCLKSRVRSVFLHHFCLKAAWRLLQLRVLPLLRVRAGRWAVSTHGHIAGRSLARAAAAASSQPANTTWRRSGFRVRSSS